MTGGPYRTLAHDSDSLHKFGRRGSLIDVALGSGDDGLEDRLLVSRTRHDDAQIRTSSFQTGHQIEQVLYVAVAKQHQVDALQPARYPGGRPKLARNLMQNRTGHEIPQPAVDRSPLRQYECAVSFPLQVSQDSLLGDGGSIAANRAD